MFLPIFIGNHQRPHVEWSRQRAILLVAVAMQNKRSHGSSVNAAGHDGMGLEVVGVVKNEPVGEKYMGLQRHAVKQGGDRLSGWRRRKSWSKSFIRSGFHYERTDEKALWTQEHDIIGQREAHGPLVHQVLNITSRYVDQHP